MIQDLGMVFGIVWHFLPYIIVISIIIVIIWMIPTWIKQWKDLDDDDWWK